MAPAHVGLPAAARRVRPREGPYLRMRLAVAVPGGPGPGRAGLGILTPFLVSTVPYNNAHATLRGRCLS